MLVIIDYGVGNLFSLKSSFSYIGVDAVVSNDIEVINKADRLILPGVGAYSDAISKLKSNGLDRVIIEKANNGTKIMGICLGMQLLLECSKEYGYHEGLALIKGSVEPLSDIINPKLKIPQIGWNALQFNGNKHSIFKYVNEGEYVYFVHSYYANADNENIIAFTDYSTKVTAAVASNCVCGCQFHPEKSGTTGLNILKGFCRWEIDK